MSPVRRPALHRAASAASLLATCAALYAAPAAAQPPAGSDRPPRILLDVTPRAVEYQLRRLSNHDLVRIDREPDDAKYRLVYFALLTRKGLGREYMDEALSVLAKMDGTTKTRVLLEGLQRVPPDDEEAIDRLLRVLLAQPADALRADRDALAQAATGEASPAVLRAVYGARMIADGTPDAAWAAAAAHDGHLRELLRSTLYLGDRPDLRSGLARLVATVVTTGLDPQTRAAAVAALAWARPDTATFRLLAREIVSASDPVVRAAAVRSMHHVPQSAWVGDDIVPLASALVALVKDVPPARRADPVIVDAVQLAGNLAAVLPEGPRGAVTRELRGLGVQIIRIDAVPEQMAFDLRWFVVEAGTPVQIVLRNPDAMPHNLLVTLPGSLEAVGTAASAMAPPADPAVKPYVPDSPLVLHATRLLNWGETDRLNFTAPAQPGEYIYVCTFPGHWVRMYGVMLVVDSMERWEAAPTVPTDPMTNAPFASQRF